MNAKDVGGAGKALLAVPTYNERDNVERLIAEIVEVVPGLDLLFLDDASPDGTGDLLESLKARYPTLAVSHRPGKLGIGSAHLDAIAWAYDKGYETLLTMDADFTHPPSYLPEILSKGTEADVVVGSRYLLPNSLDEWTLFRRLLTRGGHLLTRTLLGLREDASSAYRLYRLDRIPRAAFSLVRARGYSFFFESLYVLRVNGFRIREVPIVLPARASGRSKMGIMDAGKGLLHLALMCLVIAAARRRLLLPAEERT
jgi:dolichol-phosphate mannosyltransferase